MSYLLAPWQRHQALFCLIFRYQKFFSVFFFTSISSDEFTPVEEDEKNSSSESSTEGTQSVDTHKLQQSNIFCEFITNPFCLLLSEEKKKKKKKKKKSKKRKNKKHSEDSELESDSDGKMNEKHPFLFCFFSNQIHQFNCLVFVFQRKK